MLQFRGTQHPNDCMGPRTLMVHQLLGQVERLNDLDEDLNTICLKTGYQQPKLPMGRQLAGDRLRSGVGGSWAQESVLWGRPGPGTCTCGFNGRF